MSRACDSWKDYQNGTCQLDLLPMGEGLQHDMVKKMQDDLSSFYLYTNEKAPYSKPAPI